MSASVIGYWPGITEEQEAARRLQRAIRARDPPASIIRETYKLNTNQCDTVDVELLRDLEDISAIAEWAEREGAARMTLEVNW